MSCVADRIRLYFEIFTAIYQFLVVPPDPITLFQTVGS